MSQYNYTKKPNWYADGDVAANAKGWVHTPTGEVLVAMRGLDAKNTDALAAPTWTLTLPANGNYVTEDTMILELVSNEAVHVVGAPYIVVTIGATARNFVYEPVSSTSTSLKFTYDVVADDVDADGIVVAGTLTKGTAKIYDIVGGGQVEVTGAITYVVGVTTGILVNGI